jgi:hypothetical protein
MKSGAFAEEGNDMRKVWCHFSQIDTASRMREAGVYLNTRPLTA